MAPVGHAPDDLHAAGTVRGTLVRDRVVLLLRERLVSVAVEALLEFASNIMPLFAVWVLGDGFLGLDLDVVWKREPVVTAERRRSVYRLADAGGSAYVSLRYLRFLTSFQRSTKCCTTSSTEGPQNVM